MYSINFIAHFGDEIKRVEIGQPNGVDGSYWDVKINNYLKATIHCRNGEYVYIYDEFEKNLLDVMDGQAIVDTITDYTGEGFKRLVYYRQPTHDEYWAKFNSSKK